MTEQPQSTVTQGDTTMHVTERRAASRTTSKVWPEARREAFRRSQFLSGVEVLDGDPDEWSRTFAAFELQRVRYL